MVRMLLEKEKPVERKVVIKQNALTVISRIHTAQMI